MGGMDQGIPPVTVKRLAIAGMGIDTGRAGDVSGLSVLKHEQEPGRVILCADPAGKRRQGLLDLVGQGVALFGQGGRKTGTLGARDGENLVQIIRLSRTYQPHKISLGRQFFHCRFETLEG